MAGLFGGDMLRYAIPGMALRDGLRFDRVGPIDEVEGSRPVYSRAWSGREVGMALDVRHGIIRSLDTSHIGM